MMRIKILTSLGVLVALCAAPGQTPGKKIEMIPVKYDGLKQEILKQRGKVVVVDFWNSG